MRQISVLEKEDGMGLAGPAWWNRTWSGGHDEGQHQMLGTGFRVAAYTERMNGGDGVGGVVALLGLGVEGGGVWGVE